MNNYLKMLSALPLVAVLSACGGNVKWSETALALGEMTDDELMAEFIRLGSLEGAPGPIPVGRSEGKAGLFVWAGPGPGWSKTQQNIAYDVIWAGKVFNIDTNVECNPEQGGSFWLDNRVKGLFKWIENIPGGGRANVYYSNDAWIGDGNPTIVIDYEPTPALAFIHDEIRLANWASELNQSTYLGIMWVEIATARIPFAYFIPDLVEPYPCDNPPALVAATPGA